MKQCKIVEDLWPLYLDGTLSEDSRAFVEEHTSTCPVCSQLGKADRGDELSCLLSVDVTAPGSPESLLRRLRMRWRRLAALVLLGIMLVGGGAWCVSEWKAKQSYQRQAEQERQAYFDQLAALEAVSPDAGELLSRLGVDFALHRVKANASNLSVEYSFTWPDTSIWRLSQDDNWFSQDLAISNNGSNLPLHGGSSTNNVQQGSLRKQFTWGPLPDGEKSFVLKTSPLYALVPADGFVHDFDYAGGSLEVLIEREITVQGVKFLVHGFQVNGVSLLVRYSQLAPIGEVGVWQLTFALDDRIGNRWHSDGELDLQVRSPKVYELQVPHSPSKHWRLELSGAVQVIPGITRNVSLEGGK